MNNDQTSQTTRLTWDADGSPDSVIALLYFLMHPKIKVEAITVSCGQAYPDVCAAHLTRMMTRLGRSGIPIAAGRSTPLHGSNTFPQPWRDPTRNFWDVELPEAAESVNSLQAAELMIKVLNASSSPVTVFVSGTHTNLAQALRLDPQIAGKIGAVHTMGGALYVPGNIESEWPAIANKVAEWNIYIDSMAASEVFNAGLSINLMPLDATNQVTWTKADADQWKTFGTPEADIAAEILSWMVGYLRDLLSGGVYLWDLLTAVNLTNPEVCQAEQRHIQILTEPGPEQGRTVVLPDQAPNATVCLTPREDQVKQRVAQILSRS
jgi:purine nucleosidase/pyrimidine-specific ribonucleoside hydrolase